MIISLFAMIISLFAMIMMVGCKGKTGKVGQTSH